MSEPEEHPFSRLDEETHVPVNDMERWAYLPDGTVYKDILFEGLVERYKGPIEVATLYLSYGLDFYDSKGYAGGSLKHAIRGREWLKVRDAYRAKTGWAAGIKADQKWEEIGAANNTGL